MRTGLAAGLSVALAALVFGASAHSAPPQRHAAWAEVGHSSGPAARKCHRKRRACRVGRRSAASTSPLFGYNDNAVRAGRVDAVTDAALTQMGGANITRLTFDWRWVEPQKGIRRFEKYDEIYSAMRARGIRPLLILMFAPGWAWDTGVACNQWTQECRYPPAREHYADWRSIAAELARRYPEAAGIEVWNEPNSSTFWRSGPDPARYVELLAETFRAVKAIAPAMPVVSGGLSNAANRAGISMSGTNYLKKMYQSGAAPYMNGIGVHPYPPTLTSEAVTSPLRNNMASYRYVRDYFGDTGKPFWATEIGLSTSNPDPFLRLTQDQQASGLRSAYRALASMSDVRAVVVHELVQSGTDVSQVNTGWGVVRPDITARRAFCVLAQERGLNPCG